MCFTWLILSVFLATAGYFVLGGWGILVGIAFAFSLTDFVYKSGRAYRKYIGRHPLHWLRAKFGKGLNCTELARRLNIVESELRAFQPVYREVLIPKRSGGTRRLLVPDDKTKALQRLILRRLLKNLRVHPAAQAYVPGRSALLNAGVHAGQAVVINMDVVDFFPTTQASRIEAYFRRIGWNAEAAALLTRLTTSENGLPQGAPTSPALSNLVNFLLDVQIARRVASNSGTYTRYADDIAISYPLDYPCTIHSVMDYVKRCLKSKGYRTHGLKKRRIRRQHQQQIVTGFVVNFRPQLNRETRRRLRAVKHRLTAGRKASMTQQQFNGWQACQIAIARHHLNEKVKTYRAKDNRKVIRRRKNLYEKFKAR